MSTQKILKRGVAAVVLTAALLIATVSAAPAAAMVVAKQPINPTGGGAGGGAGGGSSGGSNNTACGVVMCLAGAMMSGSLPSQCRQYTDQYFALVSYKHGDFSPSQTAKKRLSMLRQCKSSSSNTQNSVNSRYGGMSGGI